MIKRGLCLLVVLFLVVVLSTIISATVFSVTDTCSVEEKQVMGLSDETNAHGELKGQGNYAFFLCSDFVGDITCDPGFENKVIGLSSPTNAHGEIPENTNYIGNEVCFDGLRCVNKSEINNGGCYGGYPLNVLSLSSDTNAHIGNSSNYDQKICCYVFGTAIAFWAGKKGNEISELSVVPGTTQVELIFKNTNLVGGEIVEFTVKKKNLFGIWVPLDNMPISGKVNANTKEASTTWTIPDNIGSGGDTVKLLFEAEEPSNSVITSGILTLTILSSDFCNEKFFCVDYNIIQDCKDDICEVAESGIPLEEADCSDPLTDCFCSWNATATPSCESRFTTYTDDDGVELPEKDCILIPIRGDPQDPNPCEDGIIEYTYIDCEGIEKTASIDCPAEVQLPFFGFYNFVITMLAIALIYYFMFIRENKKRR